VTGTTNSNVRYEVITQEDSEGDIIIPLPLPLLKSLGWKEGDDLTVSIDDEGKIFLKKAD
jgi:bifunctional DNA-binding transcriptional regulator/antitoxin component of YhaV-PrlF toxin-antitoxin module